MDERDFDAWPDGSTRLVLLAGYHVRTWRREFSGREHSPRIVAPVATRAENADGWDVELVRLPLGFVISNSTKLARGRTPCVMVSEQRAVWSLGDVVGVDELAELPPAPFVD